MFLFFSIYVDPRPRLAVFVSLSSGNSSSTATVCLIMAAGEDRVEGKWVGSQESKIEESGYEDGDMRLLLAWQQSHFYTHMKAEATRGTIDRRQTRQA